MPRKIIPLVNEEVYHIYNRGVDKRNVCMDKSDFLRFYLSLNYFNCTEPIVNFDAAKVDFKQSVHKTKLVEIIAYALLPNHFHLILVQKVDRGISEFMKRVVGGYTSYFNQKYKRSGSLYQGTFKRVHVNKDEQLNYLFAYVNENHFVHGNFATREIFHSSSLHYQGLSKSVLIEKSNNTYSFNDAVLLAKDIQNRRQLLKSSQILE